MSKNILTIIEFTDTLVKINQTRLQRGAAALTKSVTFNLQSLSSDEQISLQFVKVITPKDIDEDNLAIIIPRRLVILKQLSLPSQVEHEIRTMVALQIPNYVPFPREDIIFDVSILEKNTEGYTSVLVAVINRDMIYQYLRILNKAQIYPHKFIVSSFGIVQWFALQNAAGQSSPSRNIKEDASPVSQSKANELSSGNSIALLDVDKAGTEICFCQNNKLYFSRHINVGADDLKQKDIHHFIEQIGITIGAYRKSYMPKNIEQIILLGTADHVLFLEKQIHDYFQIPVKVLNPLETVISEKGLNLTDIKAQGTSLTASLGFLASMDQKHVNLMPADVQYMKKMRMERGIMTRFLIVLALTIVLLAAGFGVHIRRDTLYLNKIEGKMAEIKGSVEKFEKRGQFFQFFQERTKNSILLADVIKELYQLTPLEISFQSLEISPQGFLIMQGFADTGANVSQFQSQLVNSTLFKDVTLQYATKRKRFNREYTDFKIRCLLKPNAKVTNNEI